MAKTKRYTNDQIADAIKAGAGIIAVAARKLGCDRKTVSNYINRSIKLQQLTMDVVEENLDRAETRLMQCIDDGQISAIIFYLKTKGKHRGYTERTEITGNEGNAIEVDYKAVLIARVAKILERRGDSGATEELEPRAIGSDNKRLELLGVGEST